MSHVRLCTRLAMLSVGCATTLLALGWNANADTSTSDFVIEKTTAEAEVKDGTTSFNITVTNLTRTPLTFTAKNDACPVVGDPPVVADPFRMTELKFTIDPNAGACTSALADNGQEFVLSADGTSVPLVVSLVSTSSIDWQRILYVYFWSWIGGLILLTLTTVGKRYLPCKPNWVFPNGWRLQHLEATYSFKESWASNVTLVVGVLTAVLGSTDVLKAISETATRQAQTQAIIGSAISVALVALAPVVLQMFRRRGDDDGPKYAPTIDGVVLAGSITLSAGAGLAYIVAESSSKLDLGGLESHWYVPMVAVIVVLAGYGATNLWSTLIVGVAEKTSQPSETMEAAKLVAGAIEKRQGEGEVAKLVEDMPTFKVRDPRRQAVVF